MANPHPTPKKSFLTSSFDITRKTMPGNVYELKIMENRYEVIKETSLVVLMNLPNLPNLAQMFTFYTKYLNLSSKCSYLIFKTFHNKIKL